MVLVNRRQHVETHAISSLTVTDPPVRARGVEAW